MDYGKKHKNCRRQFIQLSRAWYAEANLNRGLVDEVIVGFYSPEGGTSGEFAFRWIELGGNITPMLCAFDDAWDALWHFRDVLEKLKDLDGKNPSPQRICEVLEVCGVEDTTPTIGPDGQTSSCMDALYEKPERSKIEGDAK